MLNGEVRFGKDWADQVTQISSWGNYCHGHIVRARAYVWACVCVALCACLSKRASLRLCMSVPFFESIHTSFYTYDVIHSYTVSTKDSDTFFFFLKRVHTNILEIS